MRYRKEILPCKGREVAQKSRGCSWIPRSVPGQVGWDLEQAGVVGGLKEVG